MAQTMLQPQKLVSQLNDLQQRVRVMHSLLIGLLGKDAEGAYRPAFVKRVLEASRENPNYTFGGAKAFRAQLRRS